MKEKEIGSSVGQIMMTNRKRFFLKILCSNVRIIFCMNTLMQGWGGLASEIFMDSAGKPI
jgi:hypothetical protein